MPIEIPGWTILVGSLSHTKNTGWFCVTYVYRLNQLHDAVAFHPQPEYENE